MNRRIRSLLFLLPLALLTACPQDQECEQACRFEYPFEPIDRCECDAFGNPLLRSASNQNTIYSRSSSGPLSITSLTGGVKGSSRYSLSRTSSSCLLAPATVDVSVNERRGKGNINVSAPSTPWFRSVRQRLQKRGAGYRASGDTPLSTLGCSTSTTAKVSKSASRRPDRIVPRNSGSVMLAKVVVSCDNGYRCETTYSGQKTK